MNKNAKYIAAIDQGTTSTRCMIFNHSGQVISLVQKEHEQIMPQPGWVEHNPLEIWKRTQEVVAEAIAKAGAGKGSIAAVGITNQRETAVFLAYIVVISDRRVEDLQLSLLLVILPLYTYAQRIWNALATLKEAFCKAHLDSSMAPWWVLRHSKF